ncbi:hypothetical protein [Pseudochryseolinea flava]|uniref:Uncharacterized protein n=1 Tax=Pseudochryseolinea flava TaxID=2059302 RepID=A0A364Y0G6_9BACT|nr:hypothetical protein [Pseudochryseolinea flava]RAW00292.1 hypothetical protein DQQ10_14650 [Pseudochryseolinea flava]
MTLNGWNRFTLRVPIQPMLKTYTTHGLHAKDSSGGSATNNILKEDDTRFARMNQPRGDGMDTLTTTKSASK